MTPPAAYTPVPVRRARLIAALALAIAVGLAGAVAVLGQEETPPPPIRDQYGGHGGTPAARTGATGRLALDGNWAVAMDPGAVGGSRGYASGRFRGARVKLPYVPNAGRIVGDAGERSHEGSVAWYRTRLRVPTDGRYVLRFESVNHLASVFLDGKRVGQHIGVYLPFEVRVDLKAGKDHTLVVRADWRGPQKMKAEGWHRAWFNFGGINREVTIRPAADVEVVAPTVRTRLLRGGRARLEVGARLRNLASGAEKLQLQGTLRRGEQVTELSFGEVAVPRGSSREVRTAVEIDKPELWAPGSPALYDLELKPKDGADSSGWRGRVGLREVRRDGKQVLLNGRPLRLRGASLHEDVPGRGDGLLPEDMDKLVAELRSLNANATRAQHALSPALMERLDEAGILVWLGIGPVDAPGAWTSRGPRLVRQAHDRVRASLVQLQTHPSVLAWNLANEAAGQGHPAGQADYIDDAARALRRRDPGHLVALDIWGAHPPREDGPMYRNIDAIGWTNYIGWYEGTFATRAQLSKLIRTKLGNLQRVFPDKVIAVTEFGAEGNTRNDANSHGGLQFQASLLRTHLRTYERIPGLAGALVWNLRDFAVAPSFGGGSIVELIPDISILRGLNEKGLHRYDGRPKPAAQVVSAEFARWAQRR